MDCGNTALKCKLDNKLSIFYLEDLTFKSQLSAYVKTLSPETKVALSSVSNSKVLQILLNILTNHFNHPIQIAATEDSFGSLKIGYQDVTQLGVDRWLTLIATHHIKTTRIIIDAGSWIKMDVVLSNDQHLGGVIISKSEQDENFLFDRFNLDKLKCSNNELLFGTSTQECLCLCNNQYGLKAVNTLLTKWLCDLNQPCEIVISGGDANDILQSMQQIDKSAQKHILDIQQKENLVLSGLSTRYNN